MKAPFYRSVILGACVANLITTCSAQSATFSFSYSYDSLNRLTNAAYSDGSSESYSYDNAGNRLSRITSAATVSVDVTPPSIPANLVSLTFTPSQLHIGWDRPSDTGGSGLSGYFIFVNGSLVATTTSTRFLLTGLMPDSQYCLRVAAYDHSTNISAESTILCLTTPVFQPPLLTPLGFAGGHFQIGIVNGTPGPYDVLVSTNLSDWQILTNVSLPGSNIFDDPTAPLFDQRYYLLRWSTNAASASPP